MLRTVHVFDVRQGTEEPSFIEWLDGMLWEHSRPSAAWSARLGDSSTASRATTIAASRCRIARAI